jgi:hypothetical protein
MPDLPAEDRSVSEPPNRFEIHFLDKTVTVGFEGEGSARGETVVVDVPANYVSLEQVERVIERWAPDDNG